MAPQTPFQDVKHTRFGMLERRSWRSIADHLATHARFDETAFQWDYLMAGAAVGNAMCAPSPPSSRSLSGCHIGHAPFDHGCTFSWRTAFQKACRLSLSSNTLPDPASYRRPAKRCLYTQDTRSKRRLLPNRYEFLAIA